MDPSSSIISGAVSKRTGVPGGRALRGDQESSPIPVSRVGRAVTATIISYRRRALTIRHGRSY